MAGVVPGGEAERRREGEAAAHHHLGPLREDPAEFERVPVRELTACPTRSRHARHASRSAVPHRQRLRHAGVCQHGGRVAVRRRPRPEVGRAHARERAAPSRAGQARHLPVHERRAVAGRHLRSEADAREVPRPAAAGRHRRHRAQDRRADAVAVHVQEVRPERHRGQRAVPARRRVRRRHLRDPLDAHRHPEPRAVAADDELRPQPGRPAVAWARGSPTASAPRTRTCRASSCCARTFRPPWARRCGTARSCRRSTRAPTSRTRSERPDRDCRQGLRPEEAGLLHQQQVVHAGRAAPRARPAGAARPDAARQRARRPAARSRDQLDGDGLPDADRGAGRVRHPQGERRPRSTCTAPAAPRAAA